MLDGLRMLSQPSLTLQREYHVLRWSHYLNKWLQVHCVQCLKNSNRSIHPLCNVLQPEQTYDGSWKGFDPTKINPLDDPSHPIHNIVLSEAHKETFPPYTPYRRDDLFSRDQAEYSTSTEWFATVRVAVSQARRGGCQGNCFVLLTLRYSRSIGLCSLVYDLVFWKWYDYQEKNISCKLWQCRR